MKYAKTSYLTGKINVREIDVTQEEVINWLRSGELVQRAFPQLSREDREFLLTGSTPEEWNEAFPPEDEE